MDDNSIGRRVDSDLAFLVRQIAQINPGKSVSLTACYIVHHSSPALRTQWRLETGHGPSASASSFEEVVELERKQREPEHKLARAAQLRREADQLEAAAKLQAENQQQTPSSHG